MTTSIVHVDMDEFFAAVEKLDDPALRGKPLLVGGDPRGRGVVCTASYEARKFGCHSAMPMAKAVRLCPQAIVLPVRGERYREVSEQVFDVFAQFTPQIEPLSIDEAFLDMAGTERLFGPVEQTARRIKQAIRDQAGLACSVGVAPNKFLAKLASDLEKPNGLTVITSDTIHTILDPLPISKLWGVGPAAAKQFGKLNIRTIAQLRKTPLKLLKETLGDSAEHFHRLANGLDDRPVQPDSRAKSIGQEQTFTLDVRDLDELCRVLLQQTQQVARRLRKHDMSARTVTLKLRYGDFTTISRSITLGDPTDVTEIIWKAAANLLQQWAASSFHPLRLLGVTVTQLQPSAGGQMSLFESSASKKLKKLDSAMDEIADRFGDSAVTRGDAGQDK